jgi:site-specific recombinase XerD
MQKTVKAEFEDVYRLLDSCKKIKTEDKSKIKSFFEDLQAQGLHYNTLRRHFFSFQHLCSSLANKPLHKATEQDIKKIAVAVENGNYAEETKSKDKETLIDFFTYLNKGKKPESVSWISTGIKKSKKKMPDELPDAKDIGKMISVAPYNRDKAIVAFIYDSGVRIGELLGMQIKDLVFDENGVLAQVTGKTGPRRIRLVFSAPYLATWINEHPQKDNKDAPLWVTNIRKNNKQIVESITYAGVRILLQRLAERAGVTKKINPHNFRHSRASYMANKLTEAQLCMYFGWTIGSDMPATYVHISGRDVENAILNIYGKGIKEPEKPEFEIGKCKRCREISAPNDTFCRKCGLPLTEVAEIQVKNLDKRVELDKATKLMKLLNMLRTGEDVAEVKKVKFLAEQILRE